MLLMLIKQTRLYRKDLIRYKISITSYHQLSIYINNQLPPNQYHQRLIYVNKFLIYYQNPSISPGIVPITPE